jgi:hypothetical protein
VSLEGAAEGLFRVIADVERDRGDLGRLSETEDHLRSLFAERVQSLSITRQEYVEAASSAREYVELFKHSFGPMVAIYAGLTNEPAPMAEFDEAFGQFITRWNQDLTGGVRIPYEFLLVIARKKDL